MCEFIDELPNTNTFVNVIIQSLCGCVEASSINSWISSAVLEYSDLNPAHNILCIMKNHLFVWVNPAQHTQADAVVTISLNIHSLSPQLSSAVTSLIPEKAN